MSDTDTNFDRDLSAELGIDLLSIEKQEEFIRVLGDTIMRSAMADFNSQLSEEQSTALSHYLESEPDTQTLLQHLSTNYPQFNELIHEKMTEMKKEIADSLAVMQ